MDKKLGNGARLRDLKSKSYPSREWRGNLPNMCYKKRETIHRGERKGPAYMLGANFQKCGGGGRSSKLKRKAKRKGNRGMVSGVAL